MQNERKNKIKAQNERKNKRKAKELPELKAAKKLTLFTPPTTETKQQEKKEEQTITFEKNGEEKLPSTKPVNKELFSYEKISSKVFVLDGNTFTANLGYELSGPFIKFYHVDKPVASFDEMLIASSKEESGWKVHISIDDCNKENLKKAWNIVKETLIDENISQAKVVKKNHILMKDQDHHQHGKQITIYVSEFSTETWQRILTEIDKNLAEANIIRGGNDSPNDKHIDGSVYLSYRNDRGFDNNYLQADEAKSYNDRNDKDPFIGVRLETKPPQYMRTESKPVNDKVVDKPSSSFCQLQ